MSNIKRRDILKMGALGTVAGSFVSVNSFAEEKKGVLKKGKDFWEPGPDKSLVKDLTPGKTTVRLAGYLGYQEGVSPAETIKDLKSKGMTSAIAGVDIWYSVKDSVVRELRTAMKEQDFTIFEVGGYRNLLHVDEKIRQENLKQIAKCLETAEKIGCPMVGTISGSRSPIGVEFPDNYNVHPDNWTLETWNLLIDGLKQILKDTAGLKATIGLEAQVTTNLDGPKAHRRIIDDIGDPRIKVNLDPTNMISLQTYFHTTELINECFDTLGEDIFGCHAKDTFIFPHQQTVHVQEVCPGRGVLDYETYLVRLSRMKWPRTLLPEHIPADQFDEAYGYIRKTAEKVGVKIHS